MLKNTQFGIDCQSNLIQQVNRSQHSSIILYIRPYSTKTLHMLISSDNKIKDLNITCLENEMRRNDIQFLSKNVNSASFLFL